MRWPSLFLLVIPIAFLCSVTYAQAASLYIDPAFNALAKGDSITLSVRLDVDEAAEECINAVDGVIRYSEDLLPVDVSVGDSIFSVWVEPPVINQEERTITFAGGTPNGYCGRISGDPRLTNTLVKLIFRSPGFSVGTVASGTSATVEFAQETTAYLNDGFGTKAGLAMYGASISLGTERSAVLQDPWRDAVVSDEIPPEQFSIGGPQKGPESKNRYYITFNTTDKQTGIDQYEVMEEPIANLGLFAWGRGDAPWIVTRSPYILEDQSLNSVIRVRALDKAGNEYIATLVPGEDLRRLSAEQMVIIGGASLVGLLLLMIIITGVRSQLRKRKLRREATADNVSGTDTNV